MLIKGKYNCKDRVFFFQIDTVIGSAIFGACEAYFGPHERWDSSTLARCYYLCRNITERLSLSDLSLRSVMEAATPARALCMHPVIYELFRIIRNQYNNYDKENFNVVMDALEGQGESFHVLFHKDVTDFNHIGFNTLYKKTSFYPINTENDSLAILLSKFLQETKWTYGGQPTRERFNRFLSVVEFAMKNQSITSVEQISGDTFLIITDRVCKLFKNNQTMKEHPYRRIKDKRVCAMHDTVEFFRFGYTKRIFRRTFPFNDLSALYGRSIMYFYKADEFHGNHTVYLARFRDYPNHVFLNLEITAPVMKGILQKILLSGALSRVYFTTIRDTFCESLGGPEEVAKLSELNEQTLNRQMVFYNNHFSSRSGRTGSIASLKEIYMEYDRMTDGAFFRNCKVMNYTLIASSRFVMYYREGYKFANFSIYDKVKGMDKVVFITTGLNRYTKKQHTHDLVSLDFTGIEDPEYREMALAFVQSTPQRLYHKSANSVIWRFFNILAKSKASIVWPCPEKRMFSLYDGIRIRDAFRSKVMATEHAAIFAIRDLLKWAAETGEMIVDDAAVLLFRSRQINQKTNTPFIPDEDISAIAKAFAERGETEPIYKEALVIFMLACMTPLRISAICSLRRSELVHTDNMDSYVVHSTSKISGGRVVKTVIGRESSKMLNAAADIGWQLSEGCPDDDIRSYIFTYKDKCGYSVFQVSKFNKLLNRICKENNITEWTAKNIRATYLTKAYIKASESGTLNEFTLRALSYHKRLGTTLTYYVNQSEALARLTDSLERQSNWKKVIWPDEQQAIRDVISQYEQMLPEARTEEERAILQKELSRYLEMYKQTTK